MFSRHPRRRAGVTLVELLVVIAIIALLATLLVAALGPARDRGRELQVTTDLTQLDSAVSVFKQKFQIPPPSFGGVDPANSAGCFRLCSQYATTATGQDASGNSTFLGPFSASSPEIIALKRMFPRIDLSDTGLRVPDLAATTYPPPATIATTSNLSAPFAVPATAPILLDPNQCLVFFLSGAEFTEFTGFSTDPTQPFKAGGSRLSGSPFFDFSKNIGRMGNVREFLPKLYNQYEYSRSAITGASAQQRFPNDPPDRFTPRWFLDGWRWDMEGMPYLYVSHANYLSGASSRVVGIVPWGVPWSQLNPQLQHTDPSKELWFVPEPAGSFSGGASPPVGFVPFKSSPLKFVNDPTWQIVTAGKNNRFGPGSPQLTVTPSATFRVFKPEGPSYTDGDAGGDDMANFHPRKLSAE